MCQNYVLTLRKNTAERPAGVSRLDFVAIIYRTIIMISGVTAATMTVPAVEAAWPVPAWPHQPAS